MAKRNLSFNVLLSHDEREHLVEIAEELGVSQGAVVRAGIQTRWMMEFQALPMCASGGRCMCPQMHNLKTAALLPEGDGQETIKE